MTIFYSMPKLLKLSGGNVVKIVEILENYKDNKNKIIGDSYLLNLDKLLNCYASTFDKAEYLMLAAYRNYADYTLLGIDYLDISYIPDIDVEKVKRNPLISTNNNQIIFKKEK